MVDIVKAPNEYDLADKFGVFLAGSIEMGKARDWQTELTQSLSDNEDVVILNPRRDDWDSSWVQSIENEQFRGQVEWELQAQEDATVIAMNFCEDTQSPITLLELGLFALQKYKQDGEPKYLIVHCPEGFWRKGNVDIVCSWYGVEMADSQEDLVARVNLKLEEARKYRGVFKQE